MFNSCGARGCCFELRNVGTAPELKYHRKECHDGNCSRLTYENKEIAVINLSMSKMAMAKQPLVRKPKVKGRLQLLRFYCHPLLPGVKLVPAAAILDHLERSRRL